MATGPLHPRSGSAGKGGKGGKLAFVSAPASEAGMDVPILLGLISIALLTNMTPCAGIRMIIEQCLCNALAEYEAIATLTKDV